MSRVSVEEYDRACELHDAYETAAEGLQTALRSFEDLNDNYEVEQELSCVEEALEIVCKKLEDAESVMATFDHDEEQELIRDSYRW